MKKLFILLSVITSTLSCLAQKIGEEMYIYRNNGQIIGFLPDEIISIEYINNDSDGNSYNEIVTQVVNTPDSTYMIPLAEIDSISFVTPKTEYQPDVVNISESLMPYISGSDSLTIYLLKSTPDNLIPANGTKLVTIEMNDEFPSGFAGEVVNVSRVSEGYKVECTLTSLEEIFMTFYNVSSVYGYEEHIASGTRQTIWNVNRDIINLNKIFWSYSTELNREVSNNGRWALKGANELSIGIKPTVHVISTMIVNQSEGTYFMCSITGAIELEEKLSIYGGINYHRDIPIRNLTIEVPVPDAPLINFYIEPGLFFDANAVLTGSLKWSQTFTFGAAFDYSSKRQNVVKPTLEGRLASSDFDIETCIEGSFGVGMYIELGLRILCSDVSRVCTRGELGAEFVGSFMISDDDVRSANNETELYERLKNSSLSVNAFGKSSIEATVARWGISRGLPWNLSYTINEWGVVPSFSSISSKKQTNKPDTYTVNSSIKGNLLFPVEVGFGLFDEEDNLLESNYSTRSYRLERDWPEGILSQTFEDIKLGERYTCSPMVNFLGIELRATPSAIIGEEITLETGDTKNVESSSADAFGHIRTDDLEIISGHEYGICFTEKGSTEGWDYIPSSSLDKYGNYSVTLTKLKSETEYIYCAYIEIDKDDFIYGDEKKFKTEKQEESFTCPDNNHPHAIDLGLPSGTKWACCNVGAHSPNEHGGYYAWGEIEEKSDYSEEDYLNKVIVDQKEYNGEIHTKWGYANLGPDISGTQYDVAHMKWGGEWCMPTLTQWTELCNYAYSEYLDDFHRVTGPNGNSIYFPRNSGTILNKKTDPSSAYWTSTLYSQSEHACPIPSIASPEFMYISILPAVLGLTVRAVKR